MNQIEEVSQIIARYGGLEGVTESELAKVKGFIQSGSCPKQLEKRFKRAKRYNLYLDITGIIFDSFPLKYLGGGYREEKSAKEGLKILEQFEEDAKNCIKNNNDSRSGSLIKEYAEKARLNDKSVYKTAYMVPLIAAYLGGTLLVMHELGNFISFMTNNKVNLSPLTNHLHLPQIIYIAVISVPGALVFHEFFCPSVIRKYRELNMRSEKKLAQIVKYTTSGLFEDIVKTYCKQTP